MNLRSLDLNLLVVLEVVVAERSVTKAATKLGVTQPAISQALGRLRSALGDELLLRTPAGMEPTPYCLKIAAPVREALDLLQIALRKAPPFHPDRSKQTFNIALDNRSAVMLGTPLALALGKEAPGVTLNMIPSGGINILEGLERNDIDLALGSFSMEDERFNTFHLFDDPLVALLRHGHPALSGDVISLRGLASVPHLALSSTTEEMAILDDLLASHGLDRKIVLRAPLLGAAPAILGSDMVAIISERGARAFAESTMLRVARLPFETPFVRTGMIWHRTHRDMPAHRWLREAIVTYVKKTDRNGQ